MEFQMNRRCVLIAAIFLAVCSTNSGASRILGLFQYNGRSHFIMFEALMKGLAAKGHDVFVVSHFPQKNKIPNYTDLSLKGSSPDLVNNFTAEFVRNFGYINLFDFMWNINLDICKRALDHPVMQNLMKSNETFDVIVTEVYGVDCCYGFIHKFKAPIIAMTSSVAYPWLNERVGNPDNPSYIPSYFLSFRPQMIFSERLVNTLFHVFTSWGEYLYGSLRTDKILLQYFGEDMPTLSELTKRTNLVFVNSYFSINQPRPTVPAFVEVGGLHIPKPEKLPKDLEIFLDEAKDGVIYFSFGSLLRAETIPEDKLRAFIEMFKKLPQRVLWKADGEALPELPPNVKTSTWLPQIEILSHPNVRVFISHGGLMSTQEAVYTGVPVLGIPLFADQNQNIESLKHTGMAIALDYDDITEETFSSPLLSVLNNKSYRENAKHISQLFRDRPHTVLETAIYWTEYVIRHKGAHHLRSAAVDMPLYQYLLLDVIAVLLLGTITTLLILLYVIKKFISFILPGKVMAEKTTRKQKRS